MNKKFLSALLIIAEEGNDEVLKDFILFVLR